jgi:hypothetical protein
MRRLWLVLCAVVLLACSGEGAPPLDELSLRDALGATPATIAALSNEQLKALADRLEKTRLAQNDVEPLTPQKTPEGNVRSVDEARRGRGTDALIVAIESDKELAAHPVEAASNDPLPPLEGTAATDTLDAERRALDGRAGAILVELLRTSGAKRLERVVQWPIAAVAIGDTVYVNAAWLVVMAALEETTTPRPTLQPAALKGNPYSTYSSIAACTDDVGMRCAGCLSTGGCDDTASLSDFGSGRAECEWLVADQKRIEQLCVSAMMSIATVARCVRDRSGCSLSAFNTSSGIALAATFIASPTCMSALHVCLSGSTPSDAGPTTTQAPADAKGCQDPFSSCASSFKACNNACKSGSCSGSDGDSCTKSSSCSSCSSCNSKNDSCGCGKSSSSTSSSSSGSSKSCQAGACKCQEGPVEPFIPSIALLAPILYLAFRSRRRA